VKLRTLSAENKALKDGGSGGTSTITVGDSCHSLLPSEKQARG
jgi:hypothetical protein